MNEVIKVSIARVSFTLEKEAYRLLEQYLEHLKVYYKGESGREEILEDIEERIAELIIERGGKERVVPAEELRIIMDILGKPYETESAFDSRAGEGAEKPKRMLYRDLDNRVIAGVCGGFGAYLRIDAVWIRIGFILFFLITSAAPLFMLRHFFGFHSGWFGFMMIVYGVLWVIVPPARTVAQKCAMHGESVSIDEIQRKFSEGARNVGNEARDFGRRTGGEAARVLGRAFTLAVGIILTIIGIVGLIGGWFVLLGLDIINGVNLLDLPDYIQMNTVGSWLKILGALVYFLPFIGMLYAGIHLSFGFKSPKWKPGLLIFIFWIISLFAFISLTFVSFKPYYKRSEVTQTLPVQKGYDTLYVKYPRTANSRDGGMYIEAGRNNLNLFYVNKAAGRGMEIVAYPSLRVYRQATDEPLRVECEMDYFTNMSIFDEGEMPDVNDFVSVTDSLVTMTPQVISKEKKFNGNVASVRLFVPGKTVVILQEPIEHEFGKSKRKKMGPTIRSRHFWFFDYN